MTLINAFIIIPIVAIVVIPFLSVNGKGWFALLSIGVNAVISGFVAYDAIFHQALNIVLSGNAVTGAIPIRIDGLSGWFIITIQIVFVAGVVYGLSYMKPYRRYPKKMTLHAMAIVLLHTTLTSLCVVQNSLVFLIVWEMMALSACIAVVFDHEQIGTIRAGINYMIQSHISIVFLMIGFMWVALKTGSYDFHAIATYTSSHHPLLALILFGLLFIGFGFKAGFVPFHTWLPLAHPAAPAHVSGIMSGVLVKIALYGIIRMVTFIKADYVMMGQMVILVSVASGLYGILNATVQRDFKKLLAYCTIENIGIIGIGIGIGLIGMGTGSAILCYLGFIGALLHTFNHSLFKSLLFYVSGIVYQQTHTRDMDHLGGLMTKLPQTSLLFLLGSLAIGGIPPFSGFVSEYLIYMGLIEGFGGESIVMLCILILTIGGLSLIGGMSVLTFTRTFGVMFLGTPRKKFHHQPQEVSFFMRAPLYFLAIVMIAVMVFPAYFVFVAQQIISDLNTGGLQMSFLNLNPLLSTLSTISLVSLLLIGIALLLWGFRHMMVRGRVVTTSPTWTCAYTVPDCKMQYTGKAFSKPMAKHFTVLLKERKKFKPLNTSELFPVVNRSYVAHYYDFFESRLIDPIHKRMVFLANYFKFIQNGRVQWYVLYGIIFIVLIVCIGLFQSLQELMKGVVGSG